MTILVAVPTAAERKSPVAITVERSKVTTLLAPMVTLGIILFALLAVLPLGTSDIPIVAGVTVGLDNTICFTMTDLAAGTVYSVASVVAVGCICNNLIGVNAI
jgi:hypothetical protein